MGPSDALNLGNDYILIIGTMTMTSSYNPDGGMVVLTPDLEIANANGASYQV